MEPPSGRRPRRLRRRQDRARPRRRRPRAARLRWSSSRSDTVSTAAPLVDRMTNTASMILIWPTSLRRPSSSAMRLRTSRCPGTRSRCLNRSDAHGVLLLIEIAVETRRVLRSSTNRPAPASPISDDCPVAAALHNVIDGLWASRASAAATTHSQNIREVVNHARVVSDCTGILGAPVGGSLGCCGSGRGGNTGESLVATTVVLERRMGTQLLYSNDELALSRLQ